MKIKWSDLGRKLGLAGAEDTVEVADNAPVVTALSQDSVPGSPLSGSSAASGGGQFELVAQVTSEVERLRAEVQAARQREEARIQRDGQSWSSLLVRDEKIPPYLGAVLAAEYEAMALADLDRPWTQDQAIPVGETACLTRVEALREHYAQVPAAGLTRRKVLAQAHLVSNGSAGLPDEAQEAYAHGQKIAEMFNRNGRK